MEIPKNKRYINKENLELIRNLPCVICKTPPPSQPEHFKTRGAGGGDELENLNPICQRCHVEKNQMGVKSFYEKYKLVLKYNRIHLGLPDLNIEFLK